MRRATLAVAAALLVGCPNPDTGKVDPYITARAIILQVQTAVSLADGIFQQWAVGQPSGEELEKTKATYYKIKTAIFNGIKLALDGVDIAEQAKEDPDVNKLLEKADAAWKDLKNFLSDLFAKTSNAIAKIDSARIRLGAPSAVALSTAVESLPQSFLKPAQPKPTH